MKAHGYRFEAEAAGNLARELLERRRPKIWRHVPVGSDVEARLIYWASRWAGHWASKHVEIAASVQRQ